MKVTRDVIQDLLPAYLAGESSADTVALVKEFLSQDRELAATVETLRFEALPKTPVALQPTREKQTLDRTKQLLHWRGLLMGLATFFTLFPFSFRIDNGRITWYFLRDASSWTTAVVLVAGLTCWCGFIYIRRRLRVTGL